MNVALITGSRVWDEPRIIFDVVKQYDAIVVGCARGADRIARLCARVLHKRCRVFTADWALGERAGPRRNRRMVRFCNWLRERGHRVTCHAFPVTNSRGTWHCARIAMRSRFLVYVHNQKG